MPNHRAHARFLFSVDVSLICAGQTYAAQSRDVSLGGMFVRTGAKVAPGTSVELRFTIPGVGAESRIPSVVRGQRPDGLAINFTSLRAREAAALDQLVKKLRLEK